MSDKKHVKSVELELAEPVIPEADELEKTHDLERTLELERPHELEATQESANDDGRLPAGRIVHDDRGNALWKWRGDTSATGSGVLKHLDANDLSVEGPGGRYAAPHGVPPRVADSGGGYDPYNQGQPRLKKGGGAKR
jgi:hypothetical protein